MTSHSSHRVGPSGRLRAVVIAVLVAVASAAHVVGIDRADATARTSPPSAASVAAKGA